MVSLEQLFGPASASAYDGPGVLPRYSPLAAGGANMASLDLTGYLDHGVVLGHGLRTVYVSVLDIASASVSIKCRTCSGGARCRQFSLELKFKR